MRGTVAIVVSAFTLATAASAQTPPPVRPVKTSDQFSQLLVSGGDFPQRVALLRAASDLRTVVLEALAQPQLRYPAARPILLIINPLVSNRNQPQPRVTEDPGGIKLQLTFAPPTPTSAPQLERALVVTILTELAVRPNDSSKDPADYAAPQIPRWLVDALCHKAHHPNPLQAPVALLPLLDAGRLPPLTTLLLRPESDPISSTEEEVDLHRCLLSFLKNREDASTGFHKLLSTKTFGDPLRTLQSCFASINGTEDTLQREWTLHVATTSSQASIMALDGPQTELEIQNLLLLDVTDPDSGRHFSYPLSQFEDYLRLPGAKNLLLHRQLEFNALRDRAHFFYTEVINTYAAACNELAAGRTKEIVRRLRNATLERESIAARLSRIRDQLNWFEAVEAPRQWTPQLAEFYRALDELPPVSERTKTALDRAERDFNTGR
jgi:hypothetical protein